MNLRWHEGARRDFDEAVVWYAEQSVKASIRFIDEVDRLVQQIGNYPDAFQIVGHRSRLALVNGFPYGIIYKQCPDHLLIVAVTHLKRKQTYWTGRF